MTIGNLTHVILLLVTVVFLMGTCFAVSKMARKWQNVMFIFATLLCSGGVFFRYAMNMSFTSGLHLDRLLIQMLQVCNFNFILLPLMLIPKCEIARQYSAFFSMFAASTVLISFPSTYATNEWYDVEFLNFWLNHVFAIALPLWMMSAKRLKPDKKYIVKVSICVFAYFLAVFLLTELLMLVKVLPVGSSFSYVHNPKNMPIITQLYNLIGLPFVHLLPLFPVIVGFFYGWAWLFKKCFG